MSARAVAPRRSAVLLVGGRSSRMGVPKALVELDGEPLLRRVARTLAAHCDELVLAAAHLVERELLAELVANVRCALRGPAQPVYVVHDARADVGPVAGLAAGLAAAHAPFAFVSGCDTPLLAEALVEALFVAAEEQSGPCFDVVLPAPGGRLEPLLAVYRTATMAGHFAEQLERGGGSPTAHLTGRSVHRVESAELARIDPNARSFCNVNRPADLATARALLAEARSLSSPGERPSRSPKGSSAGG